MSDRSSRLQARHFGPALLVLASLGIAEAAPPAGKPVFIHSRGTCSHAGRAEWLRRGRGLHGRRRLPMDAHFRSDARRRGLGSGYISRDGKALGGTVIDAERDSASSQVDHGRSWRILRSARPRRRFRAKAC